MQRAFARVLRGAGAELVIDGPAGIGKTRLLQEGGLEAGSSVEQLEEHFLDAIAGGLADLLVKTATTF